MSFIACALLSMSSIHQTITMRPSQFAIHLSTYIFLSAGLCACATSPWHANLMNNQQVIAADCAQLANERQRVQDNAAHLSEASKGGNIGAAFLVVLEGVAAVATKSAPDTSKSAAVNQAALADEHAQQASEMRNRLDLIDAVRAKKNCM
jgi:hypothetical protein